MATLGRRDMITVFGLSSCYAVHHAGVGSTTILCEKLRSCYCSSFCGTYFAIQVLLDITVSM